MMRFSEFYGPERQRELLAEAAQRRLGQAATANRQSGLILLKGEGMMVRKMAVVLIVVVSLIIGYASYVGLTAQASRNCGTDSAVLAANPELSVACQNDVITGHESVAQRAVEADAARYTAMAQYYLAQNETNGQRANVANAARYTGLATYFAANPDKLSLVR